MSTLLWIIHNHYSCILRRAIVHSTQSWTKYACRSQPRQGWHTWLFANPAALTRFGLARWPAGWPCKWYKPRRDLDQPPAPVVKPVVSLRVVISQAPPRMLVWFRPSRRIGFVFWFWRILIFLFYFILFSHFVTCFIWFFFDPLYLHGLGVTTPVYLHTPFLVLSYLILSVSL